MKDYEKLRNDITNNDIGNSQTLDENLLRKGIAISFGAKVKQEGDKAARAADRGRKHFDRATREKELEKKIEYLAAGLEDVSISLIYIRRVLGNMTGIGVSGVLLQDKQSKLITAIKKGLKIR
jgi:hypothetical protein